MFYRISEASKQTGLSCHTLRQWSVRYGINASHLSEGGQRLYTDRDIERLNLIKQAKAGGLLLSDLSSLSRETLIALSGNAENTLFFAWEGSAERQYRANFPHLNWISATDLSAAANGVLVWVGDTMTEDTVTRLVQLPCRIEIFTTYISRPHRKQLQEAGCHLHKDEPTENWFVGLVKSLTQIDLTSTGTLKTLMQTEPNLECECPNHIAEILHRLRYFAHYSLECEVATDEQAWIHRQVFKHIQDAQLSVEKALQLVVHEEGLN
jgi:DNA-binding transcriptional MerR regulator